MEYCGESRVKLIAVTGGLHDELLGPDEICAIGALGCFEKKSSQQIWEELKEMTPKGYEKNLEAVTGHSDDRGHEAFSDQSYFVFSIEDATRATTLSLCEPEYLSHLQQSLRRATADRGFYIPDEIAESSRLGETEKILAESFSFYQRASEAGVPKEDARNTLPLYAKTNIQTAGTARELRHLKSVSLDGGVPSTVAFTVEEMMMQAEEIAPRLFRDRGEKYMTLSKRPSAHLFAETNVSMSKLIRDKGHTDRPALVYYSGIETNREQVRDAVENGNLAELANLKHVHFGFLAPMSLSCFHQAIRQRTWNHSIESIYDAAKRRRAVTPPKIADLGFSDEYDHQNEMMFDLYESLVEDGVSAREAVGVLPHSLQVYDLVHVDGWNAVHSIGKRTCTKAQWEIRGIAKEMARLIKEKNPPVGVYAEPQCITYDRCPESDPCGYFKSRRP